MLILEIEDVFGLMRHFKMIWRCLGYVFQGIFSELLGQVLLHLIKGGMTYSELNESDSSPTAEAG